jgi:tRNA modification GTPase
MDSGMAKNWSSCGQLEAELYQSLIHTRTRRTASWVLSQTNGLLRQELTTLVNLKDGSSEFNRRWNALRQARSFARHLTIPWRVLVMGRPNVGKSSLVNAIVGFDRAIVFDQAGTTRDVIEASTIVDGLPASFFDTAGLREHTDDQIEYAGMLGTRRVMAACDLALVIVDATDEASYDHSLLSGLPDQTPRAVVLNKCDLLSESALQQHVQRCRGMFNNTPILTVSATTGTGVDELLNWVMCSLVPDVPKLGVPLPVGDTLQALTAIDVPEDVTAEQREQIAKRLCQLLAPPASDS